MIYAIDPGTTQSALVIYDQRMKAIVSATTLPNDQINQRLRERTPRFIGDTLVIEKVASFGMPVGAEVFETVWWSGRFAETWLRESKDFARFGQLTRNTIKTHLCRSVKAKDANIRQAILDRFGSEKAIAIGNKKNPGPLYGVVGHEFAALAVALTWVETVLEKK